LSEIEAYEALHNLNKLQKQDKAARLTEQTIAVSAGMGSKKAHQAVKKTVDEIANDEKADQRKDLMRTGKGKSSVDKILTPEDFQKILQQVDKNGGFKRS
jgi:hypothetical protein